MIRRTNVISWFDAAKEAEGRREGGRRWELGVALHPIGNCHWNYPLSKPPPQQSIRDPSFLGAGGGSWKFLAASFCIGDSDVRTLKRNHWSGASRRKEGVMQQPPPPMPSSTPPRTSDVRCECVSFPPLSLSPEFCSRFVRLLLGSGSDNKREQGCAVDAAVCHRAVVARACESASVA